MAKTDARTRRKTTGILLVEGDAMNRVLFTDLLGCAADEVYAAADGDQALETMKIVRPDLVVVDVVDPEPRGLAAVRRLKNDPERKDIPIVVISGLPAGTCKRAAMDAGCDAYIAKPVAVATFVSTVRHVLGGPRPGRKTASRLAHYLDRGPSPA